MLTNGAAKDSKITQVDADIPVESDITPAPMAPKIPPTSNSVDKSALYVALSVA